MDKIRININGAEIQGFPGQSILDAARENGIDIPTLCYDEKVEAYGACGLCVVEQEGNPKLIRACATVIAPGMIINTKTKKVMDSRKAALELLLSDHDGDCRAPCSQGCPAGTDCQGYVGLLANGEYREAVRLIKDVFPLPAAIGRVCPHPCESKCRRGMVDEPVSIAYLKGFLGDMDLAGDTYMPETLPDTGKTAAVIGGGPAGLTAAFHLRRRGHSVTIYEQMEKMGGMLRYGIPEYRLPKAILDKEIENIEKMGIRFMNSVNIGRDITLSHLRNAYDAVLITVGAWESTKMGVPGEGLPEVIGGIDFLRAAALGANPLLGKTVAIVGGGNTAMDACRTAIRLGAEKVYDIYRRTRAEMPAEDIEIEEAGEEGVIFKYLTNPLEFVGENGRLIGARLQRMELGAPDASGRRSPVPVPGAEEFLPLDSVVMALGQTLDPAGLEDVELTKKSTISSDEATFRTNLHGVFAAGDATNKGAAIAIEAIAEAEKASRVIDSFLRGNTISYKKPYLAVRENLTAADYADVKKEPRVNMRRLSPEARRGTFREVNLGFSPEEAEREAMRCLECGCHDYFECKLYKYANEYDVHPEKFAGEKHGGKVENSHPFIDRNPDKCILCGLCVRVCDEVIGQGALGLVNRGFETIVKPALDMPLKEAGCISCGTCVALCPTGALGEKLSIAKPVPVATEKTDSVCSFCGLGCKTTMETRGGLIIKSMPSKEGIGVLCSMGRFGFGEVQREGRLKTPLIRENGELRPASWEEAFLYTAKKTQGAAMVHGRDSVGVAVSERYTSEEIYLIKKYAESVLGTDNIFSFGAAESEILNVLGREFSSVKPGELLSADLIILVCTDLMGRQAPLGTIVRKAKANGAKIISITPRPTVESEEWADLKITSGDDIEILRGVVKALLPHGDRELPGYGELSASLADVGTGKLAETLADMYRKAKKAVIIYERNALSPAAALAVGDMAVLSGHMGRPREGVMELKSTSNAQGLFDLGIGPRKKDSKALLVFGENLPDFDTRGVDFIMVQDLYMTELAAKADVVLPGTSQLETEGSITDTFGTARSIKGVIPPCCGKTGIEIISGLANASRPEFAYENAAAVAREMQERIPPARAGSGGEGILLRPLKEGRLLAEPKFTSVLFSNFIKHGK